MPEIFVNYRSGDGEFAAAHIESFLSDRFGDELVFRDAKGAPGEDYRTVLNRASSTTSVLLVLMGAGWADARDAEGNLRLAAEDDFTRNEILNAMRAGALVIPVHCGRGLPQLKPSDLPDELEALAYLNALDFDVRNARDDLNRLADRLVELVPALKPDRDPGPTPPSGGVHNHNSGDVGGSVIQLGNLSGGLSVGDTSTTHFHAPTYGNHHSGSGDQHIHHQPDEGHRR
ncbi:toll/interleukin-1 receptor domain-containing protein [Saccharopolyspora tripterygii]